MQQAWLATRAVAVALRSAAVLFQCPASFRPSRDNVRNLEALFERIDRDGFLLAWEPRGPWPRDLVAGLCGHLGLIHCVDPFQGASVTAGSVYYRLHGVTGYGYSSTRADLERLRSWCRGSRGFVLFNNVTMGADAEAFAAISGWP